MKTIVFIETAKSGSSREALKAAASLGYRTVLLTERKSFIEQQHQFTDISQMIYVEELTENLIRDEIGQLLIQGDSIKAIISFVDPFVSIAAQLANEFCNTTLSVDALKIMEDKTATRNMLKENASSPQFQIVTPADDLEYIIQKEYSFPIIVKSALSKASKDVYIVENKDEMEKTMRKLRMLYPSQKIVLDEYLDGPQYLVEVIVKNGKCEIIAILKQEVTKKLKFIITGYAIVLDIESRKYNKLVHAVESVIEDLKIANAACHLEYRYVNGNWVLIEMNPRISGGAMNRMIEEAFGINLVEETIKLYLGDEPDLRRKFEKPIYTHYITIESYGYLLKVIGEYKAAVQPGVIEVFIKPHIGSIMMPALSMGHRHGYVIASGDTPEAAKDNALSAASNIKFYLEPF